MVITMVVTTEVIVEVRFWVRNGPHGRSSKQPFDELIGSSAQHYVNAPGLQTGSNTAMRDDRRRLFWAHTVVFKNCVTVSL